jgi:hypothetical protein
MIKLINLKQWNWIRLVRLALTIIVSVEAYRSGEVVFYIIGGVLLVQTIFGGTCGINNACAVKNESNDKSLDSVEYEEIK